jgi:transcriptional regulator with XRE-family HTH domain
VTVETVEVPRQTPRLPGAEELVRRRIAYERKARGWSNAELAKRMADAGCPINQSAIQKIENGNPPRTISLDEAGAFAEVFGVSLNDLQRPPTELISADLARFLRDADKLLTDTRRVLAEAESLIAGLDDFTKAAEPLLRYFGLTAVGVPTDKVQDRLSAVAELLLLVRDELASRPLEVRPSDQAGDDDGQR